MAMADGCHRFARHCTTDKEKSNSLETLWMTLGSGEVRSLNIVQNK
jgi:hypothetical protein